MRLYRLLLGLAIAAAPSLTSVPISLAQGPDPVLPKPGRDPKQPIDSAYTAKIKEYTTEVFFG